MEARKEAEKRGESLPTLRGPESRGRAKVALLSHDWSPGIIRVGTSAQEVADVSVYGSIVPRSRGGSSRKSDHLKTIIREKPNVLGVQIFDPNPRDSFEEIRTLRKNLPDSFIVVGGAEVTNSGVDVVAASGADFGFIKASEASFRRFLQVVGDAKRGELTREQWGELLDVEGLVFGYGGRWYINSTMKDRKDRPTIKADTPLAGPKTDWSLGSNLMLYPAGVGGDPLTGSEMGADFIAYTASEGCDFNCTFCSQPGGGWAGKSPAEVLAEFDALAEFLGPRITRRISVGLGDNDFLHDPKRAMEILDGLKKKPYAKYLWLSFLTNARSLYRRGKDELNEELIQCLAEKVDRGGGKSRPLASVGFGLESLSDSRLRRLKAPHRRKHVFEVARRLADLGVGQMHFMIMSDVDLTPLEQMEDLYYMHQLKRIVPEFEPGKDTPNVSFRILESVNPHRGSNYYNYLRERFGEEGMWDHIRYFTLHGLGGNFRGTTGSKIRSPAVADAFDKAVREKEFTFSFEIFDAAQEATQVYIEHLRKLKKDGSARWEDETVSRRDLEKAIEFAVKNFGKRIIPRY